jgi:signal transduction histidine kinase
MVATSLLAGRANIPQLAGTILSSDRRRVYPAAIPTSVSPRISANLRATGRGHDARARFAPELGPAFEEESLAASKWLLRLRAGGAGAWFVWAAIVASSGPPETRDIAANVPFIGAYLVLSVVLVIVVRWHPKAGRLAWLTIPVIDMTCTFAIMANAMRFWNPSYLAGLGSAMLAIFVLLSQFSMRTSVTVASTAVAIVFEVVLMERAKLPVPRTLSAAVLMTITGAAAAYLPRRIRSLTRRILEERASMAMDLHDELGSGLSSIGILATVAGAEDLDDASRRRIAGNIAATAIELGGSVADFVRSLRIRATDLSSLSVHLKDRLGRLQLAPGPQVIFAVADDLPPVALPLKVYRNVQLIAVEAIANAFRHAVAARIAVGLGRGQAGELLLWVEDDGIGMPPAPLGTGNGLANMRRRAQQVGASITWSAGAAGGTRVLLTFFAETP